MTVIVAFLALVIGGVLGMLGGGGAILTLPMLVYVAHVEPKAAITMSLFVVGVTSLFGATVHARTGVMRWKAAASFGLASMIGAFAGGRLAAFVPARVLLVLFGAIMLGSSMAMMRAKREDDDASTEAPRAAHLGGLGLVVGLVSGLVGAGGGFLIVPALMVFGRMRMRDAIGTSLLVITMQSLAGFAGHIAHAELDWTLLAVVTTFTVIGGLGGAFLGKRVSVARLRAAFASLVATMGVFIFARELPRAIAIPACGLAILVLAFAAYRRFDRK